MMSASSTLTYRRRAFTAVKRELLDEFERRYLLHQLGRFGGDLHAVRQASRLSRRHLGMLVAKHGLLEHVIRGR
jgi:DNA-binding NtrC family response regulator